MALQKVTVLTKKDVAALNASATIHREIARKMLDAVEHRIMVPSDVAHLARLGEFLAREEQDFNSLAQRVLE